uniref:ATP synthase F(0) complex subunit f, mitochondrial n=1 Tax=Leptobrachium leishanense TaxID=445787 RepID=A0A8C5QVV4_9ANUR
MADKLVPLADKRLLDIKVGQLPTWLAGRDFTPNGVLGAFRQGYYRYHNKYINVRKGGIGGITMVLAGYVVLSYIWDYDHIIYFKRHHIMITVSQLEMLPESTWFTRDEAGPDTSKDCLDTSLFKKGKLYCDVTEERSDRIESQRLSPELTPTRGLLPRIHN